MSTPVICVASHDPGESDPCGYNYRLFRASLDRFGVTPTVIGWGQPWLGLSTKLVRLRDWLASADAPRGGRVLYVDAFDVLFAEHPDEVDARCHALYGDALVFNAEKDCWPVPEWSERFPPVSSQWRYLNGGVMCGPIASLRAVIERIEMPADLGQEDQTPWQRAYFDQLVPIKLDTDCAVFQCLSACSEDEFELTGRRPWNRVTGTQPGVIHANGPSKETLLRPFARSILR